VLHGHSENSQAQHFLITWCVPRMEEEVDVKADMGEKKISGVLAVPMCWSIHRLLVIKKIWHNLSIPMPKRAGNDTLI
jgi:hypothetical protein